MNPKKVRISRVSIVDNLINLMGMGMRRIISISKIRKIIDTRKNRNENIAREVEVSSPDSKVEGFSFLKFKFRGRIKDVNIKIIEIVVISIIIRNIIL